MGKIVAAARIAASVPGAASRKDAPVHRPRIPKDPAAAASRRCIALAGGGGNRPSFRPLSLEEGAPLVAKFYARRAGRSRHENIIRSANAPAKFTVNGWCGQAARSCNKLEIRVFASSRRFSKMYRKASSNWKRHPTEAFASTSRLISIRVASVPANTEVARE